MTNDSKKILKGSAGDPGPFRTARLAYVEIGRIGGIDKSAASFYKQLDIAQPRILQFDQWSPSGLDALMLTRPPIVVGPLDGRGQLGCLANPEILLAAKTKLSDSALIPVIALAHQIENRTRRLLAGTGLFSASCPVLSSQMTPEGLHRVWMAMIKEGINPLASSRKMNFVDAVGCDSRKLPRGRKDPGAGSVES